MIYFDNAATSAPKPVAVQTAVQRALHSLSANPGRSGHDASVAAAQEVYACRAAAAELFGFSHPERVVFTGNCTQAINTVIKGVVTPPQNVVVSSLEHNAVMRPVERLRRQGCTVTVAEVFFDDPEATVRSFARAITKDTRLVICTHASNVCGLRLPVEQIEALCRQRGVPFMIDAAQSAGVLPLALDELAADYICAPGHKGLFGPMGTGVLLCKGEAPLPLTEGGTGNASASLEQPPDLPERLESGTLNVPGIAGLHAGISFVKQKTPAAIHAYEMRLTGFAYEQLRHMRGVTLYTPFPDPSTYVPVLSFNVGDRSSEETAARLNEAGFALRAGLHCAPAAHRRLGTIETGTVRFSPSVFNSRGQVERLLWQIERLAKE